MATARARFRPPGQSLRLSRRGGFAMLEVLVALVVSIIGVLGMVGLQARSYQAEAESYQRSQALIILDEIASRLTTNGGQAASYVASGIGAGPLEVCGDAADIAARDLCEIGNSLRGAGERAGSAAGSAVGAMSRGRACVTSPATGTYLIAVVWAGVVPTGAPVTSCARGEYGDDRLRRAVTTIVVVPNLGA